MEIYQLFELVEKTYLVILLVGAIAGLAYVDKKYQLGLSMGLNGNFVDSGSANNSGSANATGEGLSGYSYKNTKEHAFMEKLSEKDAEIASLKDRVATLEKMVTDPAEQLKREIDRL